MPLVAVTGLQYSNQSMLLALLVNELKEIGYDVHSYEYNLNSFNDASSIKHYVSKTHTNLDINNPYVSSTLHTLYRLNDYLGTWKSRYYDGDLILVTGYTPTTIIEQGSFIPKTLQSKYLDWIKDFEYNKCGLPKPDITLCIDVPESKQIAIFESEKRAKRTRSKTHKAFSIEIQDAYRKFMYSNTDILGLNIVEFADLKETCDKLLEKILTNVIYTKDGVLNFGKDCPKQLTINKNVEDINLKIDTDSFNKFEFTKASPKKSKNKTSRKKIK